MLRRVSHTFVLGTPTSSKGVHHRMARYSFKQQDTFAHRVDINEFSTKIFNKVASWLGMQGNQTTIGNARAILFNCKAQAELNDWFTQGQVTKDFRSKHTLLMLHVWMVHKRLLLEGKRGQLVQEALFDELWEDTSNRIRGQGINELSLNKYLKEVQGYSFRTCLELDHSLSLLEDPKAASASARATSDAVAAYRSTSSSSYATTAAAAAVNTDDIGDIGIEDDGEEEDVLDMEEVVTDEFGGVLWRMLYLRRDEVEVEHVLPLARYMREEQKSLLNLDGSAVFEGRIKWGHLPKEWKSQSNKRKQHYNKDHNQQDPHAAGDSKDSGEWREAIAADGRIYYWNTATRKTQWERPADFD